MQRSHAATCRSLVLQKYSTGQCVMNVQTMLNGITDYYAHSQANLDKSLTTTIIGTDGNYGTITKSKVLSFQKWINADASGVVISNNSTNSSNSVSNNSSGGVPISVDGKVGPQTWGMLCVFAGQSSFRIGGTAEKQAYYAAILSGCAVN